MFTLVHCLSLVNSISYSVSLSSCGMMSLHAVSITLLSCFSNPLLSILYIQLQHHTCFAGATIIDVEKTKLKRKRARNDDPEDLDNFQGPWAGFEDESTVAKPPPVMLVLAQLSSIWLGNLLQEDMVEIQEFLAKKKRRQRPQEEKPLEETTQLHSKLCRQCFSNVRQHQIPGKKVVSW